MPVSKRPRSQYQCERGCEFFRYLYRRDSSSSSPQNASLGVCLQQLALLKDRPGLLETEGITLDSGALVCVAYQKAIMENLEIGIRLSRASQLSVLDGHTLEDRIHDHFTSVWDLLGNSR